jgi:phosphonate transport system permease protein
MSNGMSNADKLNPAWANANFFLHAWNFRRWLIRIVLLVLLVISVMSLPLLNSGINLKVACENFFSNLATMLLHPSTGNDTIVKLLYSLMQTICLAILTTLLGGVFALVFALLSARNLASARLSTFIQSIMSVIRAIPTIIWVLIYSVSLGLGVNAAVIGLTFHSVAYLTKVYANSIEEINSSKLEALQAMGANKRELITQAVLPLSIKRLISWTFIRFEINFGDAVAVGAAAGAGGLGYQLFMAGNFYFNFNEVGLIIYLIMFFSISLEVISYFIRTKWIN